ncbi:hypothetical protein GQ53DRAFT_881196 [Thozetella sp. PMI_491]|nr:hypothetical protein GQ53DRAFT_881196 [Thozetella sp. PMI_491]
MVKSEEYWLRPLGWEHDPEEERIRFSTFDYLSACVYNSYALFFNLEDKERPKVIEALKDSLERTLSQCRQLVGTVQKNEEDDDHSFVKKRDSAVKFLVKYFEAGDNVPSFSDIEEAHFTSACLGNIPNFVVHGMEYGERPECLPSAKPIIAAFQANFIPGGLIFIINSHHYSNDIMGWAGFVRQLAENCASVLNQTAFPSWDPANLDATRFTTADFPTENKVDGPVPPERHPLLKGNYALLFHLPKSKAAQLKELATPGKEGETWISTYDAFSAFLWRILTKHRTSLYDADPEATPLFAEAVDMRRRADPPVAPRQQRNLFWAALSADYPDHFTVKQVVSEVPLSELAAKIRTMTNSMNHGVIDKALDMLAPIRDKTSLFTRVDSFPPLSVITTDWREADVCRADFGFARPRAYRHLFSTVTASLILIYPPRASDSADEGCEFVISIETDIIKPLLEDTEMNKFFEFRGYEVDTEK